MCGRYELPNTPKAWADVYGLLEIEPGDPTDARPEINPTDPAPIVLNADHRELVTARWWLEGPWSESTKKLTLFNARDDKMDTQFWKSLAETQRCLIPASAFIEWRPVPGRKKKQKVRLSLTEERPLAMAGIWNRWNGQLSFSVITTASNELMQPIHERMPVIVPPELFSAWLSPEPVPVAAVQSMLRAYESAEMKAEDVPESQGTLSLF